MNQQQQENDTAHAVEGGIGTWDLFGGKYPTFKTELVASYFAAAARAAGDDEARVSSLCSVMMTSANSPIVLNVAPATLELLRDQPLREYLFHIVGLGRDIWQAGYTEKGARHFLWEWLSEDDRNRVAIVECLDERPFIGTPEAITTRELALVALLTQAAVPGGISSHEFSRQGGWREQAQRVLDGFPEALDVLRRQHNERVASDGLRREIDTLKAALSDVTACLDGLGAPISSETVDGAKVDYVTRAKYVAEVALGKRLPFAETAG